MSRNIFGRRLAVSHKLYDRQFIITIYADNISSSYNILILKSPGGFKKKSIYENRKANA